MTKNVPKWPTFDSSPHYLTLKKVLAWYAKQIFWPDSIRLGYQIPKQMSNLSDQFFQSNNLLKLPQLVFIKMIQ